MPETTATHEKFTVNITINLDLSKPLALIHSGKIRWSTIEVTAWVITLGHLQAYSTFNFIINSNFINSNFTLPKIIRVAGQDLLQTNGSP